MARSNKENWVNHMKVLSIIESHIKVYVRNDSTISIELFEKVRGRDFIYLIDYDFHLFVGLHLFDEKVCFIADGGNKFIIESQKRDASKANIEDEFKELLEGLP